MELDTRIRVSHMSKTSRVVPCSFLSHFTNCSHVTGNGKFMLVQISFKYYKPLERDQRFVHATACLSLHFVWKDTSFLIKYSI